MPGQTIRLFKATLYLLMCGNIFTLTEIVVNAHSYKSGGTLLA
jgi:hypothetical protein